MCIHWFAVGISGVLVALGISSLLQAWWVSRYITALQLGGERKSFGKKVWEQAKKRWKGIIGKEVPTLDRELEIQAMRDAVGRWVAGAAALFAFAAFIISLVSFLGSR